MYTGYERPFRTKQYRAELKLISEYAPGRNLLDIGCATGWFLSEARKWGYRVVGLEPQESLVKVARKEVGKAAVVYGDINSSVIRRKKFDVVTLWSVLEHIGNSRGSLQRINSVMPRGGVLAIRTPNSRGLLPQLSILFYKLSLGRISFPLKLILQMEFVSKHWYLFNRDNLTGFLRNAGYQIKEVGYSTSFDWQHLDEWFRGRKRRPAIVLLWAAKLAFTANEIITRAFQLQDDIIIIAVKV